MDSTGGQLDGQGESRYAERISAQEADAVIQLWIERQKELQEQEGVPTVNDLAEALNAPPDEIRRLLSTVRVQNEPEPKPIPDADGRKLLTRRQRIRIAGAGAFGALLLAGVALAMMQSSRATSAPIAPPMPVSVATDTSVAAAPDASIGTTTIATSAASVADLLPQGLIVNYKGASIVGRKEYGSATVSVEEQVEEALRRVIQELSPTTGLPAANRPSDFGLFVKALTERNAVDFSNIFRIDKISLTTVRANENPRKELLNGAPPRIERDIPVSLTGDSDVLTQIWREQEVDIKVLANTAGRMLQPTPKP